MIAAESIQFEFEKSEIENPKTKKQLKKEEFYEETHYCACCCYPCGSWWYYRLCGHP